MKNGLRIADWMSGTKLSKQLSWSAEDMQKEKQKKREQIIIMN